MGKESIDEKKIAKGVTDTATLVMGYLANKAYSSQEALCLIENFTASLVSYLYVDCVDRTEMSSEVFCQKVTDSIMKSSRKYIEIALEETAHDSK